MDGWLRNGIDARVKSREKMARIPMQIIRSAWIASDRFRMRHSKCAPSAQTSIVGLIRLTGRAFGTCGIVQGTKRQTISRSLESSARNRVAC